MFKSQPINPKPINPPSNKPDSPLISQSQLPSAPVEQKNIIEELSEINILREKMLHATQNFDNELDELERRLVKKANELEILTSKEMNQISQHNLSLVREFVNYQESLIKKLEQKTSNWDGFESAIAQAHDKLNQIMSENELVPKLALIEIMEADVEKLMEEVEELKRQKERRL